MDHPHGTPAFSMTPARTGARGAPDSIRRSRLSASSGRGIVGEKGD